MEKIKFGDMKKQKKNTAHEIIIHNNIFVNRPSVDG